MAGGNGGGGDGQGAIIAIGLLLAVLIAAVLGVNVVLLRRSKPQPQGEAEHHGQELTSINTNTIYPSFDSPPLRTQMPGASLGKMSLMSDDSAAANGPSMFKAVEEPSDGNISSPRYNERLSRARAGNSPRGTAAVTIGESKAGSVIQAPANGPSYDAAGPDMTLPRGPKKSPPPPPPPPPAPV